MLNAEAFVDTTVVPIIIMFVVNLIVLEKKLRLSPLKFLRHELTNRKRKKAYKVKPQASFHDKIQIKDNVPEYT